MQQNVSSKVTVKLFLGIQITSEIRMHLRQSLKWKESHLHLETHTGYLIETHFQNNDYVGIFVAEERQPFEELKQLELAVRNLLLEYCPLANTEKMPLVVFPQVFIS